MYYSHQRSKINKTFYQTNSQKQFEKIETIKQKNKVGEHIIVHISKQCRPMINIYKMNKLKKDKNTTRTSKKTKNNC